MKYFLITFSIFILASCESSAHFKRAASVKSAYYDHAAVVSACSYASDIGLKILQDGGNAVDAAIAVQFALAVTYPVAGNIGGGGFLVLRTPDGEHYALDFRETAPALASRDMYLDDEGSVIPDLSLRGHKAAGIPGSVKGMEMAYIKFSKLQDWTKLIRPAIELAEAGFELSEMQAARLNQFMPEFEKVNGKSNPFVREDAWKAGDLLIQKDLSKTLKAIAENKSAGFYNGQVADQIVAEMKTGGGLISKEDLARYTAIWRKPLNIDYRGYSIVGMPPPSSGGIALAQLLECIESEDMSSYKFHSAEHMHLFAEAERRVYADRATYLGDPDFIEIPVETLISEEYNRQRMSDFNPLIATPSDSIEAGIIKESEQTTHFSIVDSEGFAVSLTTTINTAYGSKVWVEGAGFFLNNEMDDFSSKPGEPNFYGLVGNEANSIAPGKRMLSSMCPTIVSRDGELKMVVGTPGGSTIITSVFQVISNILDFGFDANAATQACRFYHQWLPDQIFIERENCFSDSIQSVLQLKGHQLQERSSIGKVETIYINNGKIEAAADIRGDDSASGY